MRDKIKGYIVLNYLNYMLMLLISNNLIFIGKIYLFKGVYSLFKGKFTSI
jgi:hypothetical protein